jgi:glycosyltransferase involved in cell wall biosynthesis
VEPRAIIPGTKELLHAYKRRQEQGYPSVGSTSSQRTGNPFPQGEFFFERVVPILQSVTENYEIICVNDGSRDTTLQILTAFHLRNPRIKVVNLARNFGKEAALTAGIDHATGDAVIPIDADLQDPPELIPELVERWQEGYDTVIAVRRDRSADSLLKRLTANWFYRVIGKLSEVPVPANAGDFRLLDRTVINALGRLTERGRFMKGLYAWVGFNSTTIEYTRPARAAGRTKWKYWGLWNFALDGIFSFTTLPLRIWSYLGLGTAILAALYAFYIVMHTMLYGIEVPGYASLIVLLLFFSGMNMIGLGIMGEYVGRIFSEVKQRPLYLVDSLAGIETPEHQPARQFFDAKISG